MGYAVIDLETTGFSPARGDRILEVGVVLIDDAGEVEHEWTTLINPQRDVGATHVHGIRASDVVDAPLFGDVAAHLVRLLSGRALAAHNQEFDLRFLRAELAAHGYTLPPAYAALCTMLWSRSSFGAAKLSDVCAVLEIEHGSAHAALGDARATAAVISALIRVVGRNQRWDADVIGAVFPLSSDASETSPSAGRRAVAIAPMVFVDTAALPLWERVSILLDFDDAGAAVYLDMLTRVLEDGLISTAEYSRLDAIAEVAHLSKERVVALHSEYLAAARAEAMADGVVSEDERRELAQIATILDQSAPELPLATVAEVVRPTNDNDAVVQRLRGTGGAAAASGSASPAVFTLSPGARVVFTGTLSRPREEWARALAEAGFVTGSVTKNCVALIAEDPATQSGKAKTARAHGIPIITEAQFIPAFEAFMAQNRIV
ncbi:exonuclease domain-containing protein [Microbacterium sp.]|uniref:exonuclease domain-containing protein n=1 Tax=Microbacterium sp. TaxID=51671 RepID=UPI0027329FB9|nr:exonuclease domain-containing protein [Microbacterium sp.]MDP3950378.1 exonuclease domain-containing protein [Microbacterium sp.]